MSAGFYRAFEDRYRGARETIKQRLRAYQPFIEALATLQSPPRALDVGCGRGEWLELLGEQGFQAHGVDLDEGMLAACRERGLDVELGDAIACLRRMPDASLTLVSAFHLVEHIPFEVLQALVSEAQRVLLPGGLLIMETPNAENLVVGATSFYLDPTHLRPLPPQLLAFITEYGGFQRHKVVRLQEDAALRGDAPIGLINVLDGVSPDYAVVAQKDAGPAVLAPFETAFNTDYGLSLGVMAQRFEQRLLARDDAQRAALAALETHTIDAKVRLGGAEQAISHLAQLLETTTGRLDAAEAARQNAEAARHEAAQQRAAAEQRIAALLASSSWRITAPWRMAGHYAQRARRGVKPGVKGALLALVRAALRRPRVKRLLRPLMARMPGLQARLQTMLHHAAQSAAMAPETPAPLGDMTPRTQRIYQDLQSALKTRKH